LTQERKVGLGKSRWACPGEKEGQASSRAKLQPSLIGAPQPVVGFCLPAIPCRERRTNGERHELGGTNLVRIDQG